MRYLTLLLLGLIMLPACVDVEGGDYATYGNPCVSEFRDLLLCDRETGGADPDTTPPTETAATCETACQKLSDCQLVPPDLLTECISDCLAAPNVTQQLLDCIVQTTGCNFDHCVPQ